MKRKRSAIAIETLEPRHMMSGTPLSGHLLSSHYARVHAAAQADTHAAVFQSLAPIAATETSTRWDWLAGTRWYVPSDNLLAITAPLDLSSPTPIADQTLWSITSSSGGQISGTSVAKFSDRSVPTEVSFAGRVTEEGQVRMEFYSSPAEIVTGVGQMRFVDGQWRAEMQMATGLNSITTHWAYMSLLPEGVTPPAPTDPPPPGSLRSEEWRWVQGTLWSLADSDLLGDGSGVGLFAIEAYRSGYFWGSGMSSQPFNVLGSITPEGNVLLLVSVDSGQPESRMGQISDGTMLLRTYEGNPTVGVARLVDDPRVPSSRGFVASLVQVSQD